MVAYEKFLFTAAAVYYLERENVPHISHESSFPTNVTISVQNSTNTTWST